MEEKNLEIVKVDIAVGVAITVLVSCIAGASKVVRSPHNAAADQMAPDAIGVHSRSQLSCAVTGIRQPMRQMLAAALVVGNRNSRASSCATPISVNSATKIKIKRNFIKSLLYCLCEKM